MRSRGVTIRTIDPRALYLTARHGPHRELVSTFAPALGAHHLLLAVLSSRRSSGHSFLSSALIMLKAYTLPMAVFILPDGQDVVRVSL